MKISTKGKYGMHMMCYLASHQDQVPIPLTEMAQELDLPEAYLEQLMRKLKKADFVSSIRGAYGGYSLSKPAEEIYLLDLLDCLEDGITTTSCSIDGYDDCPKHEDCKNRQLWRKIDLVIFDAFDGYSLQDLLDEEKIEETSK